mmetsp:Transcript_30988/g.71991  ORF Transcript_30988/g.71991 Transcript_30988/m.71991 type:complete len:364 (+) Transcript_30988:311-1402(+)
MLHRSTAPKGRGAAAVRGPRKGAPGANRAARASMRVSARLLEALPRVPQPVEDVLREHLLLEVLGRLLVGVHREQRLLVRALDRRRVEQLGERHGLPLAWRRDLVQRGEQRAQVLLVVLPLLHAQLDHLLQVPLRLAVLCGARLFGAQIVDLLSDRRLLRRLALRDQRRAVRQRPGRSRRHRRHRLRARRPRPLRRAAAHAAAHHVAHQIPAHAAAKQVAAAQAVGAARAAARATHAHAHEHAQLVGHALRRHAAVELRPRACRRLRSCHARRHRCRYERGRRGQAEEVVHVGAAHQVGGAAPAAHQVSGRSGGARRRVEAVQKVDLRLDRWWPRGGRRRARPHGHAPEQVGLRAIRRCGRRC